MNTREIHSALVSDDNIKKIYKGVFALDQIPISLNVPWLIVVNLDPSYKEGSHWVVLCQTNPYLISHFDSLGKNPDNYIHNLLMLKRKQYQYNNVRLQNYLTDTCGLYCIYFSYYISRGWTLRQILSRFSDNLYKNEYIVKKFCKEYFDLDID